MSHTQTLLLSILTTLTACDDGEDSGAHKTGRDTRASTGCLFVEADATCPAPEDVNRDDLMAGCGSTVVAVTGPGVYDENYRVWGPIDSGSTPACCYPILETEPTCAYGRPLRIDGEAQLAELVRNPSWTHALVPASVPGAVRAELARRWTRAALDEHASVAAFSKVVLELMRFGAGPELIEQTLQAGRDEVRHATLGFAIASAMRGEATGPGAIHFGDLTLAPDLATFAAETALEGCIGEGLASLLARVAAERTRDPVLRSVLEIIAEEESSHARLAWRTVQWAIETGGTPVRNAVSQVFDDAHRTGIAVPEAPEADLSAWGLLSRSESEALGRQCMTEVILPAAAVLLGDRPQTACA